MVRAVDPPEFDLRDQLRVISRRKRVIALVVLLMVSSTVVASLRQSPVYEGRVKVLLRPPETGDVISEEPQDQDADPARVVQTQIEVMTSEPVQAAVKRQLGYSSDVSVSQVGETDVVTIAARSTERRRAAAIPMAYAEAYSDFRRKQAVDELTKAAHNLDKKIADLHKQVEALDAQIDAATPGLAAGRPSPPNQAALASSLTARRDHLVTQQALFKQRRDELELQTELRTSGAQIVTRPPVPTVKVAPTPIRSGLVALAVGLVLGVGLAFLVEYLDDAIKTKEDLARALPGVPVLGLIPVVKRGKPGRSSVIALADRESPAAEAYRMLRTALQFLGVERVPRVFQVTSADRGEGKTTTLANLGVVLAQSGHRVVIVDCDLRLGRLHEFFGLPNSSGFTSVLLEEANLATATQPVPDVERLTLLSTGPRPPNPSELLSDKRTAEVLSDLQATHDFVLVDCPPVLPVSDPIALSAWVDATLLVVNAGETSKKSLQRSVEVLQQAAAPVVGTVLNQVKTPDNYGYGYRYGKEPASRALPRQARALARKI